MPRTVYHTNGKRWTGHIVLAEPLIYEQVKAIQDAIDGAAEIAPSKALSKTKDGNTVELFWTSGADKLRLDAIMKCVTEWHIDNLPDNVTAETFPFSPRIESSQFIGWLWNELYKVYQGEVDIPNES